MHVQWDRKEVLDPIVHVCTHLCATNIVEKYEVAWEWGSRDLHVQTS